METPRVGVLVEAGREVRTLRILFSSLKVEITMNAMAECLTLETVTATSMWTCDTRTASDLRFLAAVIPTIWPERPTATTATTANSIGEMET